MIRFFVFGLVWLAIGHRAIAFHQQLLQRRSCSSRRSLQRSLVLPNKELYVSTRLSNGIQIINGKRKFGWYSSVQDDFELEEMVDADQDPDEEEDANFRNHEEIERFFAEAERDANRRNFPKGKPEGYYVTDHYVVPESGFENLVSATTSSKSNSNQSNGGITQKEVDRLGISGTNITLPIALMLLDEEAFPSLSRARKSCR